MTLAQAYLLLLPLLAIALLATDKAHMSVIGVGLVLATAVPGLVSPDDAVSGFANPAIVTVAALFVVGEGFLRTGAAAILADRLLRRTGGRESTVILLVMLMAGFLSAFVNNTLVVITFLPVVTSICRAAKLFPSRILIPLSYATVFGGMCSLVGTSTNLLVSGVMTDAGLDPLSMFEQAPAGLCVAAIGILYVVLLARRFLPRTPSLTSQMARAAAREFVTEIAIKEGSKLVGMRLSSLSAGDRAGRARPLMLVRDEAMRWPPFEDLEIEPGDILVVSGKLEDIADLTHQGSTSMHGAEEYDPATMSFFEVALAPDSPLVGMKVGKTQFKNRFDAAIVAVQRAGQHLRERLADLRLRSGDVLLVFGDDKSKARLRQSHEVHLLEGVRGVVYRRSQAPKAFAVMISMLLLFVSGVVRPEIAALAGAMAIVLLRCLPVPAALAAVDWSIVLFLGGILALGRAMQQQGLIESVADWIAVGLGDLGTVWVLAALTMGSAWMTELFSNNAVAVLMTPIAVATAQKLHADPRPFCIAVAIAASCCFANPLGYQVHLIVLGPGGYRFRHFLRIGLPTTLLISTSAAAAICWIWHLA
ncbi:MAG: SLC13 family permease [Planctomycetota bacterium]